MNSLWEKVLRGECSAEELLTHSEFCELVIEKAAQRRSLRPDQIRCSLALTLEDPDTLGPESPFTSECGGLH